MIAPVTPAAPEIPGFSPPPPILTVFPAIVSFVRVAVIDDRKKAPPRPDSIWLPVKVLLLTVMVAFVAGMNRVVSRSAHPGNVIVLSDGATDEVFSNLPINDATEIEHQPGVVWQKGRALSSREVYICINQPTTGPDGRSKHRFLQIRGVEDPDIAAQVHELELLPGGQWLSVGGVQESSDPSEPRTPVSGSTQPLTAMRGSDRRVVMRPPHISRSSATTR